MHLKRASIAQNLQIKGQITLNLGIAELQSFVKAYHVYLFYMFVKLYQPNPKRTRDSQNSF